MRHLKVAQLGVVLLTAALLVGCTPTAPIAETSTPPTPSATADGPAPTSPCSALPLTCAELFGLAELQPLLVTPVQVRIDETSAPLGVRAAGLVQGGALTCVFGGDNRTDSSYDQGLRLQVVPQGAQWYDSAITATFPPTARYDTIGDRSVLSCQGSDMMQNNFMCGAELVVGDYWISASVSDAADLDTEAATDLATTILQTVADRIGSAGPERSLWSPPAGTDPAPLCADPGAVAALLGEDPASLTVELTGSRSGPGAPTLNCRWTGGAGTVYLDALQGGAWAFDAIVASPGMVFHPWLKPSELFELAETDGMLVTCIDTCYGLTSWQGTLVEVSFDEASYDAAIALERLKAWGALLP